MSTPEQNHQEDNENQRAERNARYYQKRTQATIQHRQHAERQAIHREEQAKAITQRQQDAERQAIHREEQTQATIQRRQHGQTTTNPSSDSGSRSIYFQ